VTQAPVLVATLGASSYTYVEATPAQDLRSFIAAHCRAFEFSGGIPEVVVPDNLKAGAAVGVALLGARLDQVSLEREQLLVKKADLQIQVDRLREELAEVRYGQAGLVVMSVNVIPEGLDELTRVRVRAEVASIVDDLVGRPVAELGPALAFHLLVGRTLTIEGAPVYLSVRAVVIGPETEFWVELRVAPAERAESGG